MNQKSTEWRGIIYSTAKMRAARIKRESMEKIDAGGPDAMFGDGDLK